MLINSCSKPRFNPTDDKEANEGKFLLSFNIGGFSQELLPFSDKIKASGLNASASRNSLAGLGGMQAETQSASETDIRDYINTIEIKVYQGKNLVDSIRQYANDPEFGKFAKYYPSGNHNVFVVGAMLENDGDVIMRKETSVNTQEVYLKILPTPTDAFTFFKTYDLSKQQEHEKIQLKRFVGKVEVHLDEKIPVGAARLEVTIENTAQYFMPYYKRGYYFDPVIVNDTIPYHTSKTILIKPEDIGREDYIASAYFVLKSALGTAPETSKVILSAYRTNGTLIQKREISNVLLQANKRTRLTGKLFSTPNVDFEVELESDWDSNVSEYEF